MGKIMPKEIYFETLSGKHLAVELMASALLVRGLKQKRPTLEILIPASTWHRALREKAITEMRDLNRDSLIVITKCIERVKHIFPEIYSIYENALKKANGDPTYIDYNQLLSGLRLAEKLFDVHSYIKVLKEQKASERSIVTEIRYYEQLKKIMLTNIFEIEEKEFQILKDHILRPERKYQFPELVELYKEAIARREHTQALLTTGTPPPIAPQYNAAVQPVVNPLPQEKVSASSTKDLKPS
jgi:hypothetical protein